MPSVLDATLVIQIVHFLCAYWILSKLFLKPAYALVKKIDAERAALKNAAIQQQEELATQRQEKIAELTEFQQELLLSAPAEPIKISSEITSRIKPVELPQVKKEWVKELVAQLKKRVIHE